MISAKWRQSPEQLSDLVLGCMQGDCSSSYKLDLDKDVYSELVPPLATPRNRQCVLLTRDRLFQVSRKTSGTWFDQLLVRLVWPTQELHNLDAITVKLPNFINMMGAGAQQQACFAGVAPCLP